MPTRIISVSKDGDSIKLIQRDNWRGLYIALSYPWGARNNFITTNASLGTMTQGVLTSVLPQTIKDAVLVCHKLGFTYLWVEPLCIIQDSASDKAKEISNMNHVFQNAFCTISATKAATADDGFLRCENLDTEMVVNLNDVVGRFTGRVSLVKRREISHADEPLNQRAWTRAERY